jgi:putative exporter of polyketide antibiotics
MKRNTLIASIALIVIGFITARVGDSLSTVTESGMVQDSMLMPIGAILFILGLLALFVAIIWYLVGFIKGLLKKDQA